MHSPVQVLASSLAGRLADCDDTLLPGARQVFRLRRGTGSMTAKLSPPAHLNHYSRRHWTVEN
jgi:hypothetical protein